MPLIWILGTRLQKSNNFNEYLFRIFGRSFYSVIKSKNKNIWKSVIINSNFKFFLFFSFSFFCKLCKIVHLMFSVSPEVAVVVSLKTIWIGFISNSYCTVAKRGVGNYPFTWAYACNLKFCTRVVEQTNYTKSILKIYWRMHIFVLRCLYHFFSNKLPRVNCYKVTCKQSNLSN